MRKSIFIIITPIALFSLSLNNSEITKMVDKIKEERVGIGLATLDTTPNPFFIVEKRAPVVEPKKVEVKKEPKRIKPTITYKLTAILNHSAFINKKWYKVGSSLGVYRVIYIGKRSVTLKSGREIKRLVIPQREKKFKMFQGD